MCFNNRVSQNNSIEMASLHEFHSDESTQDSFLIAEKMCNASPPKIQLNDVTIHESRRSAYFPDETEDNDFWQQIRKMGFHPGQNLFNTSSISMPELDTKSSVSGQSSHLCKSFNDLSYDNNKTKQTSGYCSDDNKDDSYRLRDTFDHANCHFRVFGPRRGSPQFPEPSTPKRTGTSPAKQLNFPELDITIGTNLPISPILAEKDDDFTNSYVEPSDFNNTLERIEYRLAHCPIPPMTEERRRKWKQAALEYWEELKEQEEIKQQQHERSIRKSPNRNDYPYEEPSYIQRFDPADVQRINAYFLTQGYELTSLYVIGMRRQMLEDLSQKRRAFKRTISVDELLKPPK